jgi:hypothetical protein
MVGLLSEEDSSERPLVGAVSNLWMNIPAIAEAAKKLITISSIFLNLAIVIVRVKPSKEGIVGC